MMYGYWAWWMMPMMFVCIIFIILGGIFLIRFFGRQGSNDNNKSAMDMLNQQLASGKITEDEYQRKKKLINEK